MDVQSTLGFVTVGVNLLVLVLIMFAIIKVVANPGTVDIQFNLLLTSIFMLLPVTIFENLLFLWLFFGWDTSIFTLPVMRLCFIIGLLSFFVYNMHILTIDDINVTPLTISGLITGFGIGNVLLSAQLNTENPVAPIYYDPVAGGVYFINSLMAFNVVGLTAFVYYTYFRGWEVEVEHTPLLDQAGIASFFVSPMLIYLLRITGVTILPFNFIFIPMLLAHSLHLASYLSGKFGLPILPSINSLILIDVEKNSLILSLSIKGEEVQTSLKSMAMMALESVTEHIFFSSLESEKYSVGNYGDSLVLRQHPLMMVVWVSNSRNILTRFHLSMLMRRFSSLYGVVSSQKMIDLLRAYTYIFFRKKGMSTTVEYYDNRSYPPQNV